MNTWKHPVALELKHDEKIVGGKLSIRQMKFLLPALILTVVIMKIPFDGFYGLFLPENIAIILYYATVLIFSIFLMGTAAVIAFVPARMISFFNDPKPKLNLDPYDVDETIDHYLMNKFRNRGKVKVLPYRIIK